jgi:hypothetical protein
VQPESGQHKAGAEQQKLADPKFHTLTFSRTRSTVNSVDGYVWLTAH